jgi:type II secretory pathway pseudopilin PulG
MDRLDDFAQNPQSDDQQMVEEVETKISLEEVNAPPKRPFFKSPIFLISLGLAILLLLALGVTGYLGYQVTGKASQAYASAKAIAQALEERNLENAQDNLSETKIQLEETSLAYQKLGIYRYIPLLSNYFQDGERVLKAGQYGLDTVELSLEALAPYSDVLGFSGGENLPDFESAEDRIIFIAETVEKLAPDMDKIGAQLALIETELKNINPRRYPEKIGDQEVRSLIVSTTETVSALASSITSFQPLVAILPDLLGNPEPRRYMLLFQNNAELRPTGGFMTAYATMTVTKGKIEPGVSQDIYTLDASFREKVPAPEPIKKYLPLVYNWNLRDMNLSPDFKVSMDTFTSYAKKAPAMPEVDGIIALDTEVPVRLLEILGPIGVPGYGGKFSAENDPRCNCPQVIYELENIITRPTYEVREGRKSILGPLMNSMLANIMGSPKSQWPEFFNVFIESIKEKRLLMYFYDADKQNAVEVLQAAGRVVDYPEGDYLMINNTNFAGAKSNLFVESEVEQNISFQEDKIIRKIVLTYRNPAPGDNCNLEAGQLCLNGLLRDWTRIYVPLGSKLISFKGTEVDPIVTEDLGKTVFEGFFTLSPQSVKKLEIEYEVPLTSKDEYRLLIQKQPGIGAVPHTITLNGKKPALYEVNSDLEIVLPR